MFDDDCVVVMPPMMTVMNHNHLTVKSHRRL
jgi:hypothetical protein